MSIDHEDEIGLTGYTFTFTEWMWLGTLVILVKKPAVYSHIWRVGDIQVKRKNDQDLFLARVRTGPLSCPDGFHVDLRPLKIEVALGDSLEVRADSSGLYTPTLWVLPQQSHGERSR